MPASPQLGRVLVTGATGFIGRHLVSALLARGAAVRVASRSVCDAEAVRLWPGAAVSTCALDITDPVALRDGCKGIETVFHLAGYAHQDAPDDQQAEAMHWRVTVAGTAALLDQAVAAGVRNFVFASSVKAMGEGGPHCLDEASPARPVSGYGRAKLAAEELVLAAGACHGLHTCVLRLPLVYGRDNKGNLPRMIAAVDRGRFPPLPELGNRRSMVHVDDVIQALLLAAQAPQARGQVYLVTDGREYSTREVYELICQALSRSLPRWVVPLAALRLAARLGDMIGRLRGRRFFLDRAALEKLTGSAWYSSARIAAALGYRPRHTLATALPEMVAEYRRRAGEREPPALHERP